jgi:cytochrome P450
MMNKHTMINFAKRIYFAFWWRAHTVKSFLIKKKEIDRLVFTFGGRNDSWPTVGRSLYRENKIFRKVIQDCDAILTEHGGTEIRSYFEGEVNPHFFEEESKFTCITAIQLATVDLYNSNGIYPNVVMGVSMGEPAAAYAAGALTLKEALKISLSYMTLYKVERMQYAFVFLNLNFNEALDFCKRSPVWTEIIYEDSPQAQLIACDKDDIEQLKLFFSVEGMSFNFAAEKTFIPYHTSRIRLQHKLLYKYYEDIEPKPLKCDYYSPTLGKMIPGNVILDREYWYNLACLPVLFAKTLQAVLNDGYKTFLQIGPPAISERQFNAVCKPVEIKVFNSMQSESVEIANHNLLQKQLNKIKFERSYITDNEITTLTKFKKSFNVYHDPSPLSFEYLRKDSAVHFLPAHTAWLILGYNEVEYILKQPKIFSSSILKDYDPILLGADPETHKIIRNLLQPLFSPEVISELAQFTAVTAHQLLDSIFQQDNFDMVKDYSDPLSLLVLCNFFGLSSKNAGRMLNFTGKDYHNMLYWQRLQDFFETEFLACELNKQDCLWGKLRQLAINNEFVLSNAISLLRIIWTAGMATTSALISSAIYITLTEPGLVDQLMDDEKQIGRFIEECLRLQTPITAVHRIATQEVVLQEQTIPAGSMLMLNLRSAMTDPDHYTEPERFSITRPAKKHLAFGAGIHQCIGMGMARAEARSAIQTLLARLPDLKKYTHTKPEYNKGSDLVIMSSLKLSKKT